MKAIMSISKSLLSRNRPFLSVFKNGFTSTYAFENKSVQEMQNVTVVGGGAMGSGIAQVSAQSGFAVTVVDTDEYSQKCMVSVSKSLNILSQKKFPNEPKSARKFINDVLSCIKTTQSLEEGCRNADIVIEAVIEDIDIKKDMFNKIDVLAPKDTIIVSNTSSFSIQEMGKYISHADRFGGLHFFNPVWKMLLVEVISSPETSAQTLDKMLTFVHDIGKVPVKCVDNNETGGFIVNSLIFPYLLEALRFYERGHATVADIDTAMKLGAGHPSGPFELIDIIGVDNMKSVVEHWHAKFPNNPKFFPSDTLNKLNDEKKLGRKTGQGFYSYRQEIYKP